MQWGVMLGRSTVIEPILMSLTLTLVAATLAALIWRPQPTPLPDYGFPGGRFCSFGSSQPMQCQNSPLLGSITMVCLRLGLVGNF